jgi:tetratricopeptide (TPR) repeat protein
LATYEKAITAAQNVATPAADPAKSKIAVSQMLTSEGNSYLKLRKNEEAIAAFSKAAELSPNPGVAYFNLCATQYNMGHSEDAVAACDKAIAADPNKADAYFIKGSVLIAESTTDAKGQLTPPPGTAEALKKYLELAPDGGHVQDVKQMLDFIGAKVETTYKEKQK